MCNANQLENIIVNVAAGAKEVLGSKLSDILLYGSYARGDYDSESDIDIMILLDMPPTELSKYRQAINHLASRIGLNNDIMISITLKDIETFTKYKDILPYYKNVLKEGISIAS